MNEAIYVDDGWKVVNIFIASYPKQIKEKGNLIEKFSIHKEEDKFIVKSLGGEHGSYTKISPARKRLNEVVKNYTQDLGMNKKLPIKRHFHSYEEVEYKKIVEDLINLGQENTSV